MIICNIEFSEGRLHKPRISIDLDTPTARKIAAGHSSLNLILKDHLKDTLDRLDQLNTNEQTK